MDDKDALLAAIRAHPDEDTPRLMYADWLDEHGEPERAEFIRVQIELARGAPEREALQARERELLSRHLEKWMPEYLRGLSWHDKNCGTECPITVEFHRGFIDELGLDITDLMRLHTQIAAELPLTRLAVGGLTGPMGTCHVAPLMQMPLVSRLSVLDLSNNYGLQYYDIDAITGCTQPLQLKELRLTAMGFTEDFIEHLLHEPCNPGLADTRIFSDVAFRISRAGKIDNTPLVQVAMGLTNDAAPTAARLTGQTVQELRDAMARANANQPAWPTPPGDTPGGHAR